MSNENNSSCMATVFFILTIAVTVGTGVLSWNWIDPYGFWGFIRFLFVWGIMYALASFIVIGIMSAIFSKN